ncbi:mitochondrial ribosomal small subunit component [Pseudocyphellaria aurata]|nr:mitochondrial ribosomal small subunit component [Pseudocyphellaria aurata]
MGYDFRPLRVHQNATRLLAVQRNAHPPPWFEVIGTSPPSEMLVRTQPLQHQRRQRRSKTKKPSKMFQPTKLAYKDDELRKTFFTDHPWELARTRIVLENDGKDAEKDNWHQITQPHRKLSGESVVQRQLWLMKKARLPSQEAYDQARKEFYALRLQEDVERRVAKEEALATGAYFGKSALEIGMGLEDRQYEKWRSWASQRITEDKQKQFAMYGGTPEGLPEENDAMTEEPLVDDIDSVEEDGAV